MKDATQPQSGPLAYFTEDHHRCDALWADVEAAADGGGAAMRAPLEAFAAAMVRHMEMEEHVLFPAFERATGMTMGPTRVMRGEHAQMRSLLDQMRAAVARAPGEVLDQGDTLLMLIQQHNMKEEGMLYPMCQAHLSDEWPALAKELARY